MSWVMTMPYKKPLSAYKPIEWTKVRVLLPIPVFDGYVPKVGKIYDAIRGTMHRRQGKIAKSEFCIVRIKDKNIILRRTFGMEPEYEEVLE